MVGRADFLLLCPLYLGANEVTISLLWSNPLVHTAEVQPGAAAHGSGGLHFELWRGHVYE